MGNKTQRGEKGAGISRRSLPTTAVSAAESDDGAGVLVAEGMPREELHLCDGGGGFDGGCDTGCKWAWAEAVVVSCMVVSG